MAFFWNVFLKTGTALGHYVSNIWNEERRLWLHCDDDVVTEMTEKEVLSLSSRDAYLLFYATLWVQDWFYAVVLFFRRQIGCIDCLFFDRSLHKLFLFSRRTGFHIVALNVDGVHKVKAPAFLFSLSEFLFAFRRRTDAARRQRVKSTE